MGRILNKSVRGSSTCECLPKNMVTTFCRLAPRTTCGGCYHTMWQPRETITFFDAWQLQTIFTLFSPFLTHIHRTLPRTILLQPARILTDCIVYVLEYCLPNTLATSNGCRPHSRARRPVNIPGNKLILPCCCPSSRSHSLIQVVVSCCAETLKHNTSSRKAGWL